MNNAYCRESSNSILEKYYLINIMKQFFHITLVSLLIFGTLFSSCNRKKDPNARNDTFSSGEVSFGADESFAPIIEEEMEVFHSIYVQAKVHPKYMSESEGMNLLLSNKLYMMFTSRNFKESERANLIARERLPITVNVGYDGLAFITNRANTDSCMSVKDVKRILVGEALTWGDINPKSKSRGDIIVCFDNKTSSAVHYVEDSILGGKPITSPNVFATNKTADVIDYVEKTPGAIGIIGSNWLNDKRDTTNLTWKRNIRVMAISKSDNATPDNSYKPYQGYLYNDNYPFIRTIYALLNDERGRYGLPWGFAQFVAAPKGQMILFKAGLLPYYGNISIREVQVSD